MEVVDVGGCGGVSVEVVDVGGCGEFQWRYWVLVDVGSFSGGRGVGPCGGGGGVGVAVGVWVGLGSGWRLGIWLAVGCLGGSGDKGNG